MTGRSRIGFIRRSTGIEFGSLRLSRVYLSSLSFRKAQR